MPQDLDPLKNNVFENYLRDLIRLIGENALAAKREEVVAAAEDKLFASGKAFGYYEVVSLMYLQAIAFGLEPSSIGLPDTDPDRSLS